MTTLKVKPSKQFNKDLKKIKKQNKNLTLLINVVQIIASGYSLDVRYKNHKLSGNYNGYSELHIQPDWLLIYKVVNGTLYLVRTGSHSELF